MPATEGIVIVVAQPVIRPPVAETSQEDQLVAEKMPGMPLTEATQVNVLKRGLRAAPILCVEQRRHGDGLGGRQDDRCRWRRGDAEGAEHDAEEQQAACRSKSGHGSSRG